MNKNNIKKQLQIWKIFVYQSLIKKLERIWGHYPMRIKYNYSIKPCLVQNQKELLNLIRIKCDRDFETIFGSISFVEPAWVGIMKILCSIRYLYFENLLKNELKNLRYSMIGSLPKFFKNHLEGHLNILYKRIEHKSLISNQIDYDKQDIDFFEELIRDFQL